MFKAEIQYHISYIFLFTFIYDTEKLLVLFSTEWYNVFVNNICCVGTVGCNFNCELRVL